MRHPRSGGPLPRTRAAAPRRALARAATWQAGLWLLVAGCSEYGITEKADDAEAGVGEPDIVVNPLEVDFGEVARGESSDAFLVTVLNVGETDLSLTELVVGDGAFALTNTGSSLLTPGAATELVLSFTPASTGPTTSTLSVHSDDPDEPVVDVALLGLGLEGDLVVSPTTHDFGTLERDATDQLTVTLSNQGNAPVRVERLDWTPSSDELSLDANTATNGSLPWLLAPGDAVEVLIDYAPTDSTVDTADLVVVSTDPDEPRIPVDVTGNGRDFEGFSTGWYVYDDGIAYETTSNSSHVVDHHGDADLYWYEPSGAHGLIDSSDPESDFAILRDYVIDRAGAPTVVTGPFDYDGDSSLSTFAYATYTYFLCDFYLAPTDDPSAYEISSGTVDDGIQVMVNGEILGRLSLGQSGSFPLDNAVAGEVNTLIIILVDDSAVDKYVNDLAFYKDGVMVEG